MAPTPETPSHESTDTFTAFPESEQQDQLNGPPIELGLLLQNCLGMPLFAVSLLEEFARTAVSRVESFEEQFKEANLSAISELAHALKGVAGILCARTLREMSINIEAACQNGDLLLTGQLIHNLRKHVQRILHDIPNICVSFRNGNARNR